MLYWSLFDELNTQPFVGKWWKKKNIYLPRVVGEQVDVVPYKGLDSMVEGAFRILEPTGQPILNLQQIDLVIVPGVAFTKTETEWEEEVDIMTDYCPC